MQTSCSDKVAESWSFENFDILQKTKAASSRGAAMKTETSTADKRVVHVSRHDTDRQDANNINQDLHKLDSGSTPAFLSQIPVDGEAGGESFIPWG